MTKFSLPLMKKNDYGRILLVASIAGKEVHVHYIRLCKLYIPYAG